MIGRARAASTAASVAAALLVLAGCAKKGPPSGGPPDIEPPRVIGATPDSGAAGVARDAHITLRFSEGMEPRTTGDAVALAPRVEIAQRRWSGNALTLVLADTLRADRTYTLFVAPTARDRHGNALAFGRTVVFTTADTLARGVLAGVLEARGFKTTETYLWCYDVGRGHRPDSTARDFDAIALADPDGGFRVVGLALPGHYRLWVFADLNANRSYEPGIDILAPVDSTFELSAGRPVAEGLHLRVVNPRAPATVAGSVLDSASTSAGDVSIVALCVNDTTLRPRNESATQGKFKFELPGGRWALRAFRDLDRDHRWKPGSEPASDTLEVTLEPAAEVQDLVLRLKPLGRGP